MADRRERDEPFEHAAFTVEGQLERLQRLVVDINQRGGRTRRLARAAVVALLGLMALAWVWLVVGR